MSHPRVCTRVGGRGGRSDTDFWSGQVTIADRAHGCRHPNIISFKESFTADKHLYIVMDYADGAYWRNARVTATYTPISVLVLYAFLSCTHGCTAVRCILTYLRVLRLQAGTSTTRFRSSMVHAAPHPPHLSDRSNLAYPHSPPCHHFIHPQDPTLNTKHLA